MTIKIIANVILALLFYYIGVALFGDSRWVSAGAVGLAVLIVRLFIHYQRRDHEP